MPIQEGKYKAPNWSNSTPPPINASELNALSEAVEKADTNYTRDEILSDEVKQLIGLDETATPNDAFSRITLGNKRYGVNLYVKYEDGTPVSGITITSSGSPPIDGNMVTDENGYLFLAQDSPEFTASIDNAGGKIYIDLVTNPSVSETLSETITTINMVWENVDDIVEITSSGTYTILKATSYDVCAVGGGGGGNKAADNTDCGAGGGGGFVDNALGINKTDYQTISVTIGSGGTTGIGIVGNGGTTTVKSGSYTICSANGGNGANVDRYSYPTPGSGNGNGGKGEYSRSIDSTDRQNAVGTNGIGYKFSEQSLGLAGGGGGGGGLGSYNDTTANPPASGGQPNGAHGSSYVYGQDYGQNAGTAGYGGGGGGGRYVTHEESSAGGQGVVYLRFHH